MARQTPLLITYKELRPVGGAGRFPFVGNLFVYGSVGLASLIVGAIVGLSHNDPILAATAVGMVLVLPLIWNRPVLGTYIVIGGAAVFETYALGFPDSITDRVPFFISWSAAGGAEYLIFTTAEMLMLFALGAVVLRRMSVGDKPLVLGPMFWGVGIYAAAVGFGLLYGVGTGGNYFIALWEARSQFYLFFAYLLVVNTVTDTRQLKHILWLFLIGVAIKGMVGTWRYVVTLDLQLSTIPEITIGNSLLSHEESYLFALFVLFGLILFLFRGNKGQLWFIILTSAPVIIAFLANQRRVGTLILGVGILVAGLFAHRLVKSRRKAIVAIAIMTAFIMPPYMAATWNSTGVIAQPTRAVKSAIQPSERDASSDSYRDVEALNLKYNVGLNPLIGRGYGKPIIFFIPLPYIGDSFIWWDILPHNTILWVWMRLGIVGFFAFWFLIGRALVGSVIITKQLTSPHLRSVGVFIVVALVTWVLMGALDMGLVDFRQTVLIGALIGLVSLLPQMEHSEAEAQAHGERETRSTSDS